MAVKITSRDQEILDLLREGCANKEIATRIGISPRTVKQHIRTLAIRLGVSGHRARLRIIAALDGKAVNEEKLAKLRCADQVMIRAICACKSNRDIASERGLTEMTIKNYLRDLYDLVGASSRLEVLQMFT